MIKDGKTVTLMRCTVCSGRGGLGYMNFFFFFLSYFFLLHVISNATDRFTCVLSMEVKTRNKQSFFFTTFQLRCLDGRGWYAKSGQ